MQLGGQLPLLDAPSASCRPKVRPRTLRLIAAVACVALLGWGGLSIDRWLGTQAELLRCRMAMQDLGAMVRAMRAQAIAKRCAVQLHVDIPHRAFRMTALQRGAHPYELLERTMWLPTPLEISDAPAVLTALPNGELSTTCIIIAAPTHNKRFRITTSQQGSVQLHEESTL